MTKSNMLTKLKQILCIYFLTNKIKHAPALHQQQTLICSSMWHFLFDLKVSKPGLILRCQLFTDCFKESCFYINVNYGDHSDRNMLNKGAEIAFHWNVNKFTALYSSFCWIPSAQKDAETEGIFWSKRVGDIHYCFIHGDTFWPSWRFCALCGDACCASLRPVLMVSK